MSTPKSEQQSKRKRGGQPGNHNAVKHGWYMQALPDALREVYQAALGLDAGDLTDEIAMLRERALAVVHLSSHAKEGHEYIPLVAKVVREIVRSIATQHMLKPGQVAILEEATSSVIDELKAAAARAAVQGS